MSEKDSETANGNDASQASSASNVLIDEKALGRKVDLHLLPILFIVYVVAILDRVNISNALTMGLIGDLDLRGNQPNIALAIFFVPYILFELPSNILLKKLTPSVWLAACTVVFGIVMLAQGFVRNYSGLLATRFFLGLAEAGVFPGSFYLLSFYYKREESQIKFTIYWCSVLFASAFGGLLASAIANLDGIQGLENWRWVFVLEGIATILVGILAYFMVPNFPENSRWLSQEEREFIQNKTMTTSAKDFDPVRWPDIVVFFQEPRKVLGAFMYWGCMVPAYAFAYFSPTIIRSYGYTIVETQLRSVPPFASALVLCLVIGFLSDKLRIRFPFAMLGIFMAVTGLAILITVRGRFSVQYLGICFTAMGAFLGGIMIVCWYVMNLSGHADRSIGTAWMISFGNTGGILATFTFLASDAPLYTRGYSICIGAISFSGVCTILYAYFAWREQRKARGAAVTGFIPTL